MMVWAKKNLFRSWADSIITVLATVFIGFAAYQILTFIFISGRWEIVRQNLSILMIGTWPEAELMRLSVVLVGLAFLSSVSSAVITNSLYRQGDDVGHQVSLGTQVLTWLKNMWPILLVVFVLLTQISTPGPLYLTAAVVASVIGGRVVGSLLPRRLSVVWIMLSVVLLLVSVGVLNAGVSWSDWSGLFLNLFLAAFSISLCFPLGVLLALGRRSEFPILRWMSVGFIELFRGVPLIGFLLMAAVALGFFVPSGFTPGLIVRALVVLTLFTSAYVAEIVRGGLQSVPRGQVEAARANGLTPIPITFRIVLPQALRNVIPALVGQFIALFKDTALVGAAMSVSDFLDFGLVVTKQPEFRGQGLVIETLLFIMFVFWAGSYTMSQASQRLETRLGVGDR